MNDRSLEVLAQYEFKVIGTRKGRGAILCDTDKGLMLLKEYNGTKSRMDYEEELLNKINSENIISTDSPLRNRENNIITTMEDGTAYILKRWFSGRECEAKEPEDIYEGARILGILHNLFNVLELENPVPVEIENLYSEYSKYNVELKRARNFIRGKNKRNQFELDILKSFDEYYAMACEAVENLKAICDNSNYGKHLKITHGNYNYHNIIFCRDSVAVVNFESSRKQMQIIDFYNYLRKVMEKYQWNEETGMRLLENYTSVRAIGNDEINVLKVLLSYPEKFRKVVNHYYNSNKALISDKSMDKLRQVILQQEPKTSFMLKI